MMSREEIRWVFNCGSKLHKRGITPDEEEIDILWNLMLEGKSEDEAIIFVFGEG